MALQPHLNPTGTGLQPPPLLGTTQAHFSSHIRWMLVDSPSLPRRPHPITRPRNQAFHFFPLLPPELRLRIWSFAVPRRVIELRSWGTRDYCPTKFSITPHRLPVLFRICQESRTEALRLYRLVEVGVSATQLRDAKKYVEWKYHPANPQANPELTVSAAPLPYAYPFPPAKVYLNYENDVVYLGPEFHEYHLRNFLTGTGAGHELSGLKYIALSHRLWEGSRSGRWNELQEALFSLKTRPVREVIIVPDDHVGSLEDRWYYRRHEIKLLEPEFEYIFQQSGGETAKTVVENLGEWFHRLWNLHADETDEEKCVCAEDDESVTVSEEEKSRETPVVRVKSIRRNGRTMGHFKGGLWGIQESMGDMVHWKTWNPPQIANS